MRGLGVDGIMVNDRLIIGGIKTGRVMCHLDAVPVPLVLLNHKRTFCCRIVLWDHALPARPVGGEFVSHAAIGV
jgi:hypothetical protein